MKKLLLATIMAIVFISGTIAGAMPFASAIVNPGPPQITKHLEHIAEMLTKADQRLEAVLTHVGPPEQPLDPSIVNELNQIKSTAQTIIVRVDQALSNNPTP